MTPERYKLLNSEESGSLTAEEMREGWHFCYEWDGLLINPNHKDGETCSCEPWTEEQIATLTGLKTDSQPTVIESNNQPDLGPAVGWLAADGKLHQGCPPFDEPDGWRPVFAPEKK